MTEEELEIFIDYLMFGKENETEEQKNEITKLAL